MRPPLLPLLVLWVPRLLGTLAEGEGCNGTARAGLEAWDAPSDRGLILNVSASDQGRSGSLLLSWDEPEGGAEGYLLTLSPLGSGTLLQNGSVGPNITNFWFHGLTPGAYYEIEVTATLHCMDTARQTVTAQTTPEHHDSSTARQPHPRRTSCRSFARPQPEPEQQRQPGLTARLLGSRQRAAGWLPAHPVPQRLTGAGEKCIRPTKRHRVPV